MSKGGGDEIPTEQTYSASPITEFYSQTKRYPSNAEMWWAYKRPLEVGTDRPPKNYLEVFDPSLLMQVTTGNAPSAKGHYIYDALRIDRSGVSGVRGFPVKDAGGYRPITTAFFAGRVFYAGVNTFGWNTKVYFSQIIERPSQVQNCHQAMDPTDENLRDLLPTDGGVIIIPDMAECYHIQNLGNQLFVFGSNGVWQIGGSDGLGFRANDYSVSKISGTPCVSATSFVSVEGAPIWWNRTGIYTIQMSDLGTGKVVSLSDDTIKRFYDDIPVESKYYAKGAYDALKQRVQWIYRQAPHNPDAEVYYYDSILNLDTRTGAFYKYVPAIPEDVGLVGIFTAEGYATESGKDDVVVGGESVAVLSEPTFARWTRRTLMQSKIKYITEHINTIPGGYPEVVPG